MNIILSISIVIFDQNYDELACCVRALVSSVRRSLVFYPDGKFVIYIISNDDYSITEKRINSLKEIGGNCLNISVIAGHGNVGYGRGHNLVLGKDLGKYHLVMNADVVVEDDTIKNCLDWMETNSRTVVVTANGYNEQGKYLYLSKRFPDIRSLAVRSLGLDKKCRRYFKWTYRYIYADVFPANEPATIEVASGCFMFIRTTAFKVVDGFNPSYFLYFEDFDLSLRIGKLGNLIQLPFSITHAGGDAAKKGIAHIRYFCVSAFRFFFRYGVRFFYK